MSEKQNLAEQLAARARLVRKQEWMQTLRDASEDGKDSVCMHVPMYKNQREEFQRFLEEVESHGFRVKVPEKASRTVSISWADNEFCENLKS